MHVLLLVLTHIFFRIFLTGTTCERSGDHDLEVPFLGTQAWIRSLNFSIIDDWRAWHLDGQAAGLSHFFEYIPHGLCVVFLLCTLLLNESFLLHRFTIAYANNLTFATIKVILFYFADNVSGPWAE
jgi:hypothetical protein